MQLTFADIDLSWKLYLSNADYGDLSPTVAEFEGVIYE